MKKIEVIVGGEVGNGPNALSIEKQKTWKFMELPTAVGHIRNIYVTKNALQNELGWNPGEQLKVTVEVLEG